MPVEGANSIVLAAVLSVQLRSNLCYSWLISNSHQTTPASFSIKIRVKNEFLPDCSTSTNDDIREQRYATKIIFLTSTFDLEFVIFERPTSIENYHKNSPPKPKNDQF